MERRETGFVARVEEERKRQRELWGDVHDNLHSELEWDGLVLMYAGKSASAPNVSERKRRLVQVAALCYAMYQRLERAEENWPSAQ